MGKTGDFKIIPGREELAEVDRDLRFYPADSARSTTFKSEEIDQFNRDGFLRPIRIFTISEIGEIRKFFDDLLAAALAEGQDSYSISTAHLKYGTVYDILTNPLITAYVSDILGENVVAWGSHFFCKMPHDGKKVSWHQDASYWPLTPSRTVTVWLAIDDADTENACMRFIPNSHLHGHIPFQQSSETENNVLDQTVENAESYGGVPVDDILRAGEASFHNDLLLHGSNANDSDRRRCGLTLRYCAAEVRAGMDWNLKGVVVRGNDESGHWANPPRPES